VKRIIDPMSTTLLQELLVRVNADTSGLTNNVKDAISTLESAGDRANRVGNQISKAFEKLGVGDTGAKIAAQAKQIQSAFDLIEQAHKDGRITADDYARAQEGVKSALEKLTGIVPPIAQSFDKLADAFKAVNVSSSQLQIGEKIGDLSKNLKYLDEAYKAGKISAADFAKAQASVAKEIESLSKTDFTAGIKASQDRLDSIANKAKEFGATLTASVTLPIVGIAGAAIKSAADMQSLEIGLKAVTKEAGPLEVQLNRLKEVAKLPGLGFKEAVQGSINLQAAGFSAKTSERALMAFGNALATVGKGRADLDGVVLALSQIASKGKVSAEEINQLAERLPQIRVAIKGAFGEGFTDAKAFEAAGISAETFVEKIIAQFEKLPRAAGGFANDLENIKDATEQALAEAGKALLPFASAALQAFEPIISGIKELAELFAALPGPMQTAVVGVAALAAAAGPLLYAFGGITSGVKELLPMLGKLATSGAPAGEAIGAVSTSASLLAGALTALGAVVVAINFAEVATGAIEFAQAMDEIYQASKNSADGSKAFSSEVKSAGVSIEDLYQHAKVAADYIGAHFWEAVVPGASVRQSFRDLALGIQELTGRFPLLENAAKKAQEGVADSMRKMGQKAIDDASGKTTADAVNKNVEAIYAQKAANLQELKVAQDTLKALKAMKASKEELAAATMKVTEAQRKLHPELTATGNAAGIAAKKVHEAKEKFGHFSAATAEAIVNFDKLRDKAVVLKGEADLWDIRLNMGDFDKDAAALDESISKIITRMTSLSAISKEVGQVLQDTFKQTLKDANQLEDILKAAGVKSAATAEAEAKAARERLENIQKIVDANGNMIATQTEYDGVLKDALEKERALAVARGESKEAIEALDKQIEVVNKRLADHGVTVKGVKDQWKDFSKEVSTIITNFAQDAAKTLFDGTKNWGEKFTKLWRDLRDAVTASFIQPVTAALSKFVSETLTGLLSGKGLGGVAKSISDIGSSIKSVFGIGASATKAGASAASNTADFGGFFGSMSGKGGGGSAASSALSGAAGWVGAAGSIANAIVSGIGLARLEGTMNQVERNTAQLSINLAHLINEATKWWPRLGDINDDFYKYFEYFASLMTTVEEIRDKLQTLADQTADANAPLVAAIEALPEGQRGLAEVLVAALESSTDRITAAIRDAVTALSSAIREGGIGGSSSAGGSTSGDLAELQMKRQDAIDKQNALLEKLPASLAAELRAGELAHPADANESAMVRNYYDLYDVILALEHDINSLKGQTIYSGSKTSSSSSSSTQSALDPETATLDPSKLPTTINATVIGGGGGIDPTALAGLYEMIDGNFKTLFGILTNDGATMKAIGKGQQDTVAKLDEVKDGQETSTDVVAEAVDTNTKITMSGSAALADAIGDLGETITAEASASTVNNARVGLGGVGAVFGSDSLSSLAGSFKAAGMSDSDAYSFLHSIGLDDVAEGLSAAGGSIASAADALAAAGFSTVADLRSVVASSGANSLAALTSPKITGASSFEPINNYNRPSGSPIVVNVGSIRGRDDVDYLVSRIGDLGVR